MSSGPTSGRFDLARVDETDRQHLVAPVQELELAFPAGLADEVRDHEDQASAV